MHLNFLKNVLVVIFIGHMGFAIASIPEKPFYFLRHGETDWNHKGIYMGSKDIPLNETGEKQAKAVAEKLKGKGITVVISSPLQRAYRTAAIVAGALGVPLKVEPTLSETRLGVLEGQPVHKDFADRFYAGEKFDGAETVQEFDERVLKGVNSALSHEGIALIVSHGGVYDALQRWMKWPHHDIGNCTVIFHEPHQGAWNVTIMGK